jgi:hypothetical protein
MQKEENIESTDKLLKDRIELDYLEGEILKLDEDNKIEESNAAYNIFIKAKKIYEEKAAAEKKGTLSRP